MTTPVREIPSAPSRVADAVTGAGLREQLRWFGTLWVMALAFHYSDSQPLGVFPVLVFGLPALLFPSSAAAFGLALVTGAVVAALNLPSASNHLALSLLIALAFGGAALGVWLTRARSGAPRPFVERWLECARGPAGLVLLVVYLFTVLDKLNTAFFDPAVSCAGSLLSQLIGLNGLGWVTLNPVVVQASSVGTVLVEATILVCLAVPGLRCWGVLLGVGLHSVLAMASFYDFATIVFALYVLLVPAEVFDALAPRSPARRRLSLIGFAAHVLLSLAAGLAGESHSASSPIGLTWHTLLVATWFVAVGPYLLPLVRGCLAARACGIRWPGWRLRPSVLLLVPLLAFTNGTAPYLGLKTVASYSMFSNLHTERGATNHLLPGLTALEVVPYQRDTVTVTAIRFPDHRVRLDPLDTALGGMTFLGRQSRWTSEKPPVLVPYLELRRTVRMWRDAGVGGVRLAYVHDGVARTVPDATADPELSAPLPWWQRHLTAFRAIDSGSGPDRCRW